MLGEFEIEVEFPDDATDQEIATETAALVKRIDAYYRACGGAGLELTKLKVYEI